VSVIGIEKRSETVNRFWKIDYVQYIELTFQDSGSPAHSPKESYEFIIMTTIVRFGKYKGETMENMLADTTYMKNIKKQPWVREQYEVLSAILSYDDESDMEDSPLQGQRQPGSLLRCYEPDSPLSQSELYSAAHAEPLDPSIHSWTMKQMAMWDSGLPVYASTTPRLGPVVLYNDSCMKLSTDGCDQE